MWYFISPDQISRARLPVNMCGPDARVMFIVVSDAYGSLNGCNYYNPCENMFMTLEQFMNIHKHAMIIHKV